MHMKFFKLPTGLLPFLGKRQLAKFKQIAMIVALLQCVSVVAFGQSTVARGKVLNENNEPIAVATVQLKNTTTATATDSAGNFTLTVPSRSGILVFSYVGYSPTELAVSANSTTVQLQPLDNSLGEVVVVGYGTQ